MNCRSNKNVMYNFFINLIDLLKISIFIKNHSKRHIQSIKKTLQFSRARYARAFWGSFWAFININIDLGISKIENITCKHTKFNVCKNDCTCARNILSFYLLYVNEIAKTGCFVVKWYAVRDAKTWRYAVRKAEIGRHAVRNECHPHGNALRRYM